MTNWFVYIGWFGFLGLTACVAMHPSRKLATAPQEVLLVESIKGGDVSSVEGALARGVDPNICDSQQTPALVLAVLTKRAEMVEPLLKRGANPNLTDFDGYTALMRACVQPDGQMVRLLINAGTDVNKISKTGDTALTLICQCGYNPIAAVDDSTQRGREDGCLQIAQILLRHGAKQDMKGIRDSPAKIAAMFTNQRIADLLEREKKGHR